MRVGAVEIIEDQARRRPTLDFGTSLMMIETSRDGIVDQADVDEDVEGGAIGFHLPPVEEMDLDRTPAFLGPDPEQGQGHQFVDMVGTAVGRGPDHQTFRPGREVGIEWEDFLCHGVLSEE